MTMIEAGPQTPDEQELPVKKFETPVVSKPVFNVHSILPPTPAEQEQIATNKQWIALLHQQAIEAGAPAGVSADYRLTYYRDGTPMPWSVENGDRIEVSYPDQADSHRRLSFGLHEQADDLGPELTNALSELAQEKLHLYGPNGGGYIHDTDLMAIKPQS